MVHGLNLNDNMMDSLCDGCLKRTAPKSLIPMQRSSHRASHMLDRVHSNVCGPLEVQSLGDQDIL